MRTCASSTDSSNCYDTLDISNARSHTEEARQQARAAMLGTGRGHLTEPRDEEAPVDTQAARSLLAARLCSNRLLTVVANPLALLVHRSPSQEPSASCSAKTNTRPASRAAPLAAVLSVLVKAGQQLH
jgi:hypothetical protein